MSKHKQNIVKLDGKPFETKKPEIMLGRPIAREPMRENQIKFQQAFFELSGRGYKTNFEDLVGLNWWLKHHSANRNHIFHEFLSRPNAEYLILVDDDMTFENLADDVEKMINEDKDIIIGITSVKPVPHFPNLGKVESIRSVGSLKFHKKEVDCYDVVTRHIYTYPKDELFEIDFGSMGLTCIKREVVKKMENIPWCYFPPNFHTGNVYGEDVSFFINAKLYGFKVWCDPTIFLGHLGYTAWNCDRYASHWIDFKDNLIKESKEEKWDCSHNLSDEVQSVFNEKTDKIRMLI